MNSDVDLIPLEYRAMRRRVAHAWLAAAMLAAIVVLSAGAAILLGMSANRAEKQNEERRTRMALGTQQSEQLAILDQRLADLEEEWTVLRGLRSGAAAEDLFLIIDTALPAGDVWFEDWQFRRAGVTVPETASAVATGYFIVVPANGSHADTELWQVRTTMTIRGMARDHAALSRFVRGLYEQPRIQNVKLNRTSRLSDRNAVAVGFDLSVILHSDSVTEG